MSPSRKSAPSAVVGLDIGSDSIKVAEAKLAKGSITITGLGIARTPEGVIENEVIVDPKALGAAIKTLLAENGIKTKACISSVAGQSRVVVRVIEVPKMSKQELAETMKWEVERHVPFAPNDVVMDFQPLEVGADDPAAQNMEVLLAVAQNELITGHVEALQAAGLKPVAIDIEQLAAGRSLIELSKNGAKTAVVAIVNIGAHNTDLGIFENGVLTFPSPPLSIAGISFTREISEALGQTLQEAETTKKEYAAVNLDAFDSGMAAPAPNDAPVASQASEPTSFATSVGPSQGFDFGASFEPEDQPAAPAADPAPAAELGLAAEPAQLSDFKETFDGPVFDGPDLMSGVSFDQPAAGPSFDLGGEPAPAPQTPTGPAFDLGGDESSEPAEPGAFDLGSATPVDSQAMTPTFDLDDDEPAPAPVAENLAAPSFDMSDTNAHADPGEPIDFGAVAVQPVAAPGSGDSVEDRVFQAISGVLVDLANELRRSLEYYATRYSRMPEKIYLCGGTAKMPHLDEFLSRELGVPVEVADPAKNLSVNVAGMSDRYLREVSSMLSVSIGLAIRDMIG